jgi:hypothetical protein
MEVSLADVLDSLQKLSPGSFQNPAKVHQEINWSFTLFKRFEDETTKVVREAVLKFDPAPPEYCMPLVHYEVFLSGSKTQDQIYEISIENMRMFWTFAVEIGFRGIP